MYAGVPGLYGTDNHRVSPILSKICDDEMSIGPHKEGESAQDPFERVHDSLDIQHEVPV
jgi:hypothetical protein